MDTVFENLTGLLNVLFCRVCWACFNQISEAITSYLPSWVSYHKLSQAITRIIENLKTLLQKNFGVDTINSCFCAWNLWQFGLLKWLLQQWRIVTQVVIDIIMLQVGYQWSLIVLNCSYWLLFNWLCILIGMYGGFYYWHHDQTTMYIMSLIGNSTIYKTNEHYYILWLHKTQTLTNKSAIFVPNVHETSRVFNITFNVMYSFR